MFCVMNKEQMRDDLAVVKKSRSFSVMKYWHSSMDIMTGLEVSVICRLSAAC